MNPRAGTKGLAIVSGALFRFADHGHLRGKKGRHTPKHAAPARGLGFGVAGAAGAIGWGGLTISGVIGAIRSGFSGAAMMVGFFVLVVAVIALARGQVGWARLGSRAAGGVALGASMITMTVGALASPPTTSASVTAAAPSSSTTSVAGHVATATPTPEPIATTRGQGPSSAPAVAAPPVVQPAPATPAPRPATPAPRPATPASVRVATTASSTTSVAGHVASATPTLKPIATATGQGPSSAPTVAAPPEVQTVPAPPKVAPGDGPPALGNDGTLPFKAHHRGAYAGHGRVKVFHEVKVFYKKDSHNRG